MRCIWPASGGFCNAPRIGQSTLEIVVPELFLTCISNATSGPFRETVPASVMSRLPRYSLPSEVHTMVILRPSADLAMDESLFRAPRIGL